MLKRPMQSIQSKARLVGTPFPTVSRTRKDIATKYQAALDLINRYQPTEMWQSAPANRENADAKKGR